jgi:hypothetical protein
VNFERLEQVMRFVTDNPDLHDQGMWITTDTPCGTTACLAGWTCLLNGYAPAKEAWKYRKADGGLQIAMVRKIGDSDGEELDVFYTACEILDVDPDLAAPLFGASQTLDSLWTRVEALTDGRVKR